mmetsp:Transcript_77160/g.170376  ORF Transcript_77160/g.170376 Transcript_77160/m.170376 type:complete len:94 (+) Transcript_77160:385-666(+)
MSIILMRRMKKNSMKFLNLWSSRRHLYCYTLRCVWSPAGIGVCKCIETLSCARTLRTAGSLTSAPRCPEQGLTLSLKSGAAGRWNGMDYPEKT